MADERDHLLTVRQVAERWNTDASTIRRYIRNGVLHVVRVGPSKLLRIRLSTVREQETSVGNPG